MGDKLRRRAKSQKKKRLPLGLFMVSLLWAIYWLPGISSGIIGLIKYFFWLNMIIMSLLPRQITLCKRTIHRGQKYSLIFSKLLIIIASWTFMMGVIFSPNLVESFTFWTRFAGACLVYMALSEYYRKNPQFLTGSFKILTIPVIISVIYVIMSMMGIIKIPVPKIFKTSYDFILADYMMGLSYRSNAMGWAISYVLPIIVYFSAKTKGLAEKWMWRSYAVGSFYILFLLKGRGAVVSGMVSSGLVLWLLFRNRRTERLILGVIVFVIVFVFGFSYLSSVFLWKMEIHEGEASWNAVFMETEGLDEFSSGRFTIAMNAFRAIKNNPLTGIGIGQTDGYGFTNGLAHNLLLNVASGSGVFAGLIVLLFFFYVGVLCFNIIKKKELLDKDDFIIVPWAMIIAFFPSIIVEGGSMFGSFFQGISFWYALSAIVVMIEK